MTIVPTANNNQQFRRGYTAVTIDACIELAAKLRNSDWVAFLVGATAITGATALNDIATACTTATNTVID